MADSETKSLSHQVGAYALHAQHDSKELTAAARAKFLARFFEQTDPSLPEAERIRRAEFALRSHMAKLALRSAKARRRRAGME